MILQRYDILMKLFFELRGTESSPVVPKRGNVLIKRLLDRLRSYEYRWDSIVARIVDCDELSVSQINPSLAQGSFDLIRWDIIDQDSDLNRRCYTYNNIIKSKLAKALTELRFSRYNTTLAVTRVSYN